MLRASASGQTGWCRGRFRNLTYLNAALLRTSRYIRVDGLSYGLRCILTMLLQLSSIAVKKSRKEVLSPSAEWCQWETTSLGGRHWTEPDEIVPSLLVSEPTVQSKKTLGEPCLAMPIVNRMPWMRSSTQAKDADLARTTLASHGLNAPSNCNELQGPNHATTNANSLRET